MHNFCDIVMALALVSVVAGCVTPTGSEAEPLCRPFDEAAMARLQAAKEPQEVVFFASWCESCRESIDQAPRGRTLLVGVFDTPDNIERVYRTTGSEHPCYIGDDETLAHFGVKSLPYSVSSQGEAR